MPAPASSPSSPPSPLRHALQDYLGHLGVERGLAENTLGAYRRDLQRYVDFLESAGVADASAVREEHVSAYVVALRDGSDGRGALTASSAARAASAVRGWHRFLLEEGHAADDPAHGVRPPVPPRRLPKALDVAEVARLLDAAGAAEPPVGLRDRALLELLYGSGARISEAVGLDVDDVVAAATADGVVRLRGKGSKERVVPVGSYARAALEEYLVRARPALVVAGRGTPALFVNSRGGRLSRQSAWAVLQSAAVRARLGSRVSPHTLRHSFATHLLAGGADVRVVQELLGHASVTTTQVYTLVTADSLREVHAATHPRALRRSPA